MFEPPVSYHVTLIFRTKIGNTNVICSRKTSALTERQTVSQMTYWLDYDPIIASFPLILFILLCKTGAAPTSSHWLDTTVPWGGEIIGWTCGTSAEQTAGRNGVDVRWSHMFEMRQVQQNVYFPQCAGKYTGSHVQWVCVSYVDVKEFCIQTLLTLEQPFPFL